MDEVVEPFPDEGDHRVRVARERRERMRKRLLESVLVAHAETQLGGPPTVEAIIATARVSKATFYKYFNSVDEAVGVLGAEMAEEMVESLRAIFRGPETPLFQMTTAIQMFLIRSVNEPLWATYVARTDVIGGDNEVRRGLEKHIRGAQSEGSLEFENYDAAVTLAVGTLIQGMRRASSSVDPPDKEFIGGVILLILRALGAQADVADELVGRTAAFIRGTGPDGLQLQSRPMA